MQPNIKRVLDSDRRPCVGAVIAITGPKWEIRKMANNMKDRYDRVIELPLPDDYGEFPDLTGYMAKDFQHLETEAEDPALHPYMQNALDAVVQWSGDRMTALEKAGYSDIEGFMHAPTFGGRIWAIAGFIRAWPAGHFERPSLIVVPNQLH